MLYLSMEPIMWKVVYMELLDQWWAMKPLSAEDHERMGYGYRVYEFENEEDARNFADEMNEFEGLPKKWTITDAFEE